MAAEEFWLAVTGSTLSPRRGDDDKFATLLPAEGDPYLRVQTVRDGPGGVHPDLHVTDVAGAAKRAETRGAVTGFAEPGLVVLRSPGGFGFCLVTHHRHGERTRPTPHAGPDGHRSQVDQVCLDIPADRYDDECAFWAALTGWELRSGLRSQFRYLVRPDGMPLRLLLQRLDEPTGAVRAHLDFSCDDVTADAERHVSLGATRVRVTDLWTTLRDPAGLEYCLTVRDPSTGTVPGHRPT